MGAQTGGNRLKRLLGSISLALALLQLLHLSALYAAKRTLAESHDRFLAAEIYQRIAATVPRFDRRKPCRVDFYGTKTAEISVYPAADSSTVGSSFFDWDQGNPQRIVAYMHLIGYPNLVLINQDERPPLRVLYEEMPIWPAPGAIHLERDIALIKLGDVPGPLHR